MTKHSSWLPDADPDGALFLKMSLGYSRPPKTVLLTSFQQSVGSFELHLNFKKNSGPLNDTFDFIIFGGQASVNMQEMALTVKFKG